MMKSSTVWAGLILAAQVVSAYRVPIADTDALREVCSGMWGGSKASIELSFNPTSQGQVALVIYEWKDVQYLGVDTPESVSQEERPKTYICTTSAVRSGLCQTEQLGSFITSLPDDTTLESTSIYTTAVKFVPGAETADEDGNGDEAGYDDYDNIPPPKVDDPEEAPVPTETTSEWDGAYLDPAATVSEWDGTYPDPVPTEPSRVEHENDDDWASWGNEIGSRGMIRKRTLGIRQGMSSIVDGVAANLQADDDEAAGSPKIPHEVQTAGQTTIYATPIVYKVPKTGYYCIGIVPVTLVDSRAKRSVVSGRQAATHAEYSGMVEFHNVFDGELPAVEYPKINFYLLLSVIYFALGCGWTFLCFKHRDELLPMQYYISGGIIFLVIEMVANFGYYRYINKHGGGTASLAFLFVVSILNAARNSLSFFLLLIVSMGLSVVRQSLGSVMTKVRILTGLHFVFGVLYSVGTVEVELDSAALLMVMLLIFPLAFTLTAFLMWIIVSLNGTIMFLQTHKQRMKLQMFQRLWRILIMAVIAIAAFFVVSSMSLSNRLDEDYAPNNWRYRWILLDGSLALIYLAVFSAVAWIWRPTRNNRSFSMSQELAQDEADAEDYEIDNLENGTHRPLDQEDGENIDDDDEDARKPFGRQRGPRGEIGEENTVFALDDSDDEGSEDEGKKQGDKARQGYRDSGDFEDMGEEDESDKRVEGKRRSS